jgi:hypothetical protein
MIITDLTMLGKSIIPNINPKNIFKRLSKVLLLIEFFISINQVLFSENFDKLR